MAHAVVGNRPAGPDGWALRPQDVAEAIAHVVTPPRRVAIGEVLLRPTGQLQGHRAGCVDRHFGN
ncbi:hypothetical protein GCM10010315_30200 [Streptomyces luteosporeus]|uniref:Uncharacterized protein n=1 Tax=Streptomyces luteosporeus TaxID=173856 RepID=A0ABN3TSE4_9ACTN